MLEAKKSKKITMKSLPQEITGGEYGSAKLYEYAKTKGSYEYIQIDYEEYGDYGDEGEKYNQGYTLECEVEIIKGQIHLDTEVTDLGRPAHQSFGKKYSGLVFDDVSKFTTQIETIIKEFDKL